MYFILGINWGRSGVEMGGNQGKDLNIQFSPACFLYIALLSKACNYTTNLTNKFQLKKYHESQSLKTYIMKSLSNK